MQASLKFIIVHAAEMGWEAGGFRGMKNQGEETKQRVRLNLQ